jgi:hypothetical protein
MVEKTIRIDPLTAAAVRLDLLFEDKIVALGSGFLWQEAERICIVTAWHNVTGTHPATGQPLSKTAVRPDSFRAHFIPVLFHEPQSLSGQLYGADEVALFRSHHTYGKLIDVVALDIDLSGCSETLCVPINHLEASPMRVQVGGSAFVIGFPKGMSDQGLPIWKRGTIASEPTLADEPRSRESYLLDAATRQGMSGAPVVLLDDTGYQDQKGSRIMDGKRAHRFLGLYSGRVASEDQMDAQLGLVWPARFVREVAASGVADEFTLRG